MTRVLLLDDSVTILKVVRLTFASTPGYEVDVAKNEAEARALLAQSAPNVVVGYARFVQEKTPQFFEEIRSRCPHILVLTESNENTGEFERAGFQRFLKKPFHSDELRKAVAEFVGAPDFTEDTGDFGGHEFSSSHDEPTRAVKPGTRPASPPPPPPPPPPPGLTLRVGQAPRISDRAPAPAHGAQGQALAAAQPEPEGIPEITMDVASLERSYRATLTQQPGRAESEAEQPSIAQATGVHSIPPASGAVPPDLGGFSAPFSLGELSIAAPTFAPVSSPPADRPASFGNDEPDLTFSSRIDVEPASVAPSKETNPFVGLFDAAARRGQLSSAREIDLGPAPTGPLELENVVVNTPLRSSIPGTAPVRSGKSAALLSGIDRSDIQAAIDDALMRALERAVPAKIESKLESEWRRLADDVALRIKPEVVREVQSALAETLRQVLEAEVRREMRGWIQREAVTLAKGVVREEIRRLIEEG